MSTSTRIRLTIAFCLSSAALLFAADARAQFYLGAEGGWTSLPDQTITVPGLFSTNLKFNAGFNAGGRLGYEWGPWRFEEEYSYRQNNVPGNFSLFGLPITGISGNRHTNSIMTNVLYDFTLGYPITPHIGVGIGAVNIHDGLKLPLIGQFINDSTWQFGYQAIAGIRYNLSPALALDLDYRYLATTQPTFRILNTNLLRYRSDYNTNNFVASLIYRFAPPPPPVPAAAPARRRRPRLRSSWSSSTGIAPTSRRLGWTSCGRPRMPIRRGARSASRLPATRISPVRLATTSGSR